MIFLTGFKEIPGYTNYVINTDGIIISKKTGTVLSTNINGAGYLTVTVTNDKGVRQGLGLHRALGLTYIPNNTDKCFDDIVINHIDGEKLNNKLSNLEWVTYQTNQHHAGLNGLTEKCKPISIRHESGDVIKFNSYVDCAKYLNVTKDAIIHRVKTKGMVRFKDGYQYRTGISDEPWPEPMTRALLVKIISTDKNIPDKKIIFETKQEVAQFLNVSPSTITMRLKEPVEKIYLGNVQVGYLSDFRLGPIIK